MDLSYYPQAVERTNNKNAVLTVSQLSQKIKSCVETQFDYVQVQGEISGLTRAASGHVYFTLKDTNAVIDAICWRGTVSQLGVELSNGMELVCTGNVTTYPGRSKYQVIVKKAKPAGQGDLLALLEKTKQKLKAEGLFDLHYKKPLPFLPQTIGIVTSPTGAVIRDILHRLSDRCPAHVIVWPARVQGDGAHKEIIAGIQGLQTIDPRPDLIIVARGGGSLEDLWCFNEEEVARAAFACKIPLISAVGHEVDTTLIDYVSDKRAPTPTAAAEIAMPVRFDLQQKLASMKNKMYHALRHNFQRQELRLKHTSLKGMMSLLETKQQRLDQANLRLSRAMERQLSHYERRLSRIRLPRPQEVIMRAAHKLSNLYHSMINTMESRLQRGRLTLSACASMTPCMDRLLDRHDQALTRQHNRLNRAMTGLLTHHTQRLGHTRRLVESCSYQRILQKGFGLVKNKQGQPITSATALSTGDTMTVVLADGHVTGQVSDVCKDQNE
jgi:exodeoxyribonuclease VII large subunit